MFIVDDILLSPFKGLMFVFKEIHKEVMKEFCDEEKVYEELRRLQYLLDIGEISEKMYERMENALIERLQEIEEYKEQMEEESDEYSE
ncbi:Gas vesicle protein G [Pelotomaculum schinkii]|uniref:Gas vesicle protein G n=1 Tax=Pelotomaculum schinkii TaxID=78350 RepID=A0A4Y7RDT6_9FIRM|nr:gas vesicle protein GvpG [Pelotomaculum schinkii]TEB07185.1 Gas vesicle protein G [Pelotomaculum schinkii]